MKKYGIKMLGQWTDFPGHIVYTVYEGALDSMQKFQMVPEMMAWLAFNTIETKVVLSYKEVSGILRKVQ